MARRNCRPRAILTRDWRQLIGIDLLDSPDTVWLWNHAHFDTAVSIGIPVALHELYDTLAIGASRISVLRLPRY